MGVATAPKVRVQIHHIDTGTLCDVMHMLRVHLSTGRTESACQSALPFIYEAACGGSAWTAGAHAGAWG